jgi:hypothetical protein
MSSKKCSTTLILQLFYILKEHAKTKPEEADIRSGNE